METDKETPTRTRRLRHIGRFLPYLKAAAALLLLSHSSFYFPASPNNPSDFLRRAAAVLVRPGFVFLIGNAIILLLFAKSGQNSSSSESNSFPVSHPPPPPNLEPMEEMVCDDKGFGVEICALNRSRSEKFERVREEGKLRRAETSLSQRSRKGVSAQDRGDSEGVDDGEQFRRTIEEFIAKQQRFQREECSPLFNSPPE
ncbi:hypothetical protein KSP40_PGU018660 [Platanthera guangdongensis]|uniref:DUF4408 domain-containing protein n=1 Tax=Platanthera guangdongensis TaxID=2320717 RepID=A0ABR2LJW0_9ASPA